MQRALKRANHNKIFQSKRSFSTNFQSKNLKLSSQSVKLPSQTTYRNKASFKLNNFQNIYNNNNYQHVRHCATQSKIHPTNNWKSLQSIKHAFRTSCRVVGGMLRETANQLDKIGASFQGNYYFKEELSRHRRIMPFEGKWPILSPSVHISPNSSVIGNVKIGSESTIWYGAVLRGDTASISVGNQSSIGDRTVVHVTKGWFTPDLPTKIGNQVVVEPAAILHACTLQDGCKIESGAVICDEVVVESGAIVGARALVPPGKVVKAGELWAGSPARFIRKLTEQEVGAIPKEAEALRLLALKHDEEHAKTEEQRKEEMDEFRYYINGDEAERFY